MADVNACFAADGVLAHSISGFAPRPQQRDMAQAVSEALAQNHCLVVEAGTGTGKTFAYLVPALLSGKKVIISTGTRTLQDQLYHRDLPAVREALAVAARLALLKGRANYLCRYRLDLALCDGRVSAQVAQDLEQVRTWAGRTRSGDIAELHELGEDAAVWPLVTSTAENCLGTQCPDWDECHVVRSRRRAQQADVLVVNHHLLLADMALKEEGFGELLPGAHAFILDEAHALPDVASQFLGQSLSSRQLRELARDTRAEQLQNARDMAGLAAAAEDLEQAVRVFRLALGERPRREPWFRLRGEAAVERAVSNLAHGLESLCDQLEAAAPRSAGLDQCQRRALQLHGLLQCWMQADASVDEPEDTAVFWVDVYARAFVLHRTPLEVAQAFQAFVQAHAAAWVFTSATLAVGERFEHFTERLGLGDARTLRLGSPFDYQRRALLYLPAGLPEPRASGYTRAVVEAALPVVEASGGRAFFLFTSYRALYAAAEQLRERLAFPLLVQGEQARGRLLERFRSLGNAVLLGTGSFWEGVDVRGPALSCVIIDKLPFAAPDDPVLRARLDSMRRRGANPFVDFQVPSAVIALKQGVGRLIRDSRDRGVLMLCDPRLLDKAYGRVFLNSLPPMPRTRELAAVSEFLANEEFATSS